MQGPGVWGEGGLVMICSAMQCSIMCWRHKWRCTGIAAYVINFRTDELQSSCRPEVKLATHAIWTNNTVLQERESFRGPQILQNAHSSAFLSL